jgi:hypothetical protein
VPRRTLRALVLVPLLFAALLSLACAGSALAAPAWLAATNLSNPGFTSVRPEVGVDSNGESVASWYGSEPTTGELAQVSAHPRGGGWLPFQTLRRDGAINPDLAVGASGTAVIAWEFDSEEGSPDGSFIEAAVRTGGAWSVPAPLPKDTPLQVSYFPRVAVSPAGNALAVWQQCYSSDNKECFDGKGEYVARAAVRPAGGSWSMPMVLSSPSENAIKLSPAIDDAGDLAVAWEDMKGSDVRVAVRRAGGAWTDHTLTASASGSPQVAFAANGTATAVWDEFETNAGYWVAEATATGTSWSSLHRISEAGLNAFQPVLAVAPDGDAAAAWETPTGSEENGPIQVARRVGGAWLPPESLSGPEAKYPRVAIDPAGAAAVVWQTRTGSSGTVVEANTMPAGGSWSGAKALTAGSAEAAEPDVAIDPEGNATAVWQAENGGFTQAAGFDAAGPRLDGASIPGTGTVGQSLGFSASPSDAWSGVASTSWSFGDGASASGASVSHAFSQPGTYRVTVTTTDALGSSSSATGTVVVSAGAGESPLLRTATTTPANKKKGTPTKQGVAAGSALAVVRHGKASLTLRCGAAGPCAGIAKLVYRRSSVIGKSAFSIGAGGSRTLRIAIGPAALRLLAASEGQKLSVRLEGRGLKSRKVVLVL